MSTTARRRRVGPDRGHAPRGSLSGAAERGRAGRAGPRSQAARQSPRSTCAAPVRSVSRTGSGDPADTRSADARCADARCADARSADARCADARSAGAGCADAGSRGRRVGRRRVGGRGCHQRGAEPLPALPVLVERPDHPTTAPLAVLGRGPVHVDVEQHGAPARQPREPEEQPASPEPGPRVVHDEPPPHRRPVQQVDEDPERVGEVHQPAVAEVGHSRQPGPQPPADVLGIDRRDVRQVVRGLRDGRGLARAGDPADHHQVEPARPRGGDGRGHARRPGVGRGGRPRATDHRRRGGNVTGGHQHLSR